MIHETGIHRSPTGYIKQSAKWYQLGETHTRRAGQFLASILCDAYGIIFISEGNVIIGEYMHHVWTNRMTKSRKETGAFS